MTDWKTTVRNLTVQRNTSEQNAKHAVGEITRIEVEVGRQSISRGASTTIRRTVTYRVRDGIAEVTTVAPTYPNRTDEDGHIHVHHLAPMLVEADRVVAESVPEVECVRALSSSLRNERAKHDDEHPHANTDGWEAEVPEAGQ